MEGLWSLMTWGPKDQLLQIAMVNRGLEPPCLRSRQQELPREFPEANKIFWSDEYFTIVNNLGQKKEASNGRDNLTQDNWLFVVSICKKQDMLARSYRIILRQAIPGRRRQGPLWKYRPKFPLKYRHYLGIEMGTQKLRIEPACESEGLFGLSHLTWIWNGGNNILCVLEGKDWSRTPQVMQSE